MNLSIKLLMVVVVGALALMPIGSITAVGVIGDVNGDGCVNDVDAALVGQSLRQVGVPGWIPEDVAPDGIIDVLDLIVIGQHWSPALIGDVNSDCHVNVLDMVLIGQHFGQAGVSDWIPEDVHPDGTIDVLDMILTGQHWTG